MDGGVGRTGRLRITQLHSIERNKRQAMRLSTTSLTTSLIAATLFCASAEAGHENFSYSRTNGNSNGRAKIEFAGVGTDLHNDLVAYTKMEGRYKLLGSNSKLGFRVEATGVDVHNSLSASTKIKVFNTTLLHDVDSSESNPPVYNDYIPIAGPAKSYGLGPFSIAVAAGLWVDPVDSPQPLEVFFDVASLRRRLSPPPGLVTTMLAVGNALEVVSSSTIGGVSISSGSSSL